MSEFDIDPRIHLEQLESEEQITLKKAKDAEATLRLLLAELKALRQMKAEEEHKIETEGEEKAERLEIAPQEDEEDLEELVQEAQTARVEGTNPENTMYQSHSQPLYNLPTSEDMAIATSKNTISELYSLGKKEQLSEEEKHRLWSITNSAVKSVQYEVNPLVKQQVIETYNVAKTILTERKDIVNDYKAGTTTTPLKKFLDSLK